MPYRDLIVLLAWLGGIAALFLYPMRAFVSQGVLASRLPRLLAATRARWPEAAAVEATPLENARALREVLVDTIERFGPRDAGDQQPSGQALQYHIPREEYVQGASIKQITLRHSISEATFFRYRNQAIRAVAREVTQVEAGLSS